MAKGPTKIQIDTALFELLKSGRQDRMIVPAAKRLRAGDRLELTVPVPKICATVAEAVSLDDIASEAAGSMAGNVMLRLAVSQERNEAPKPLAATDTGHHQPAQAAPTLAVL